MKIPNDRWTLTKQLLCCGWEFIGESQKRWSFANTNGDSSSDHRRTVFGKSWSWRARTRAQTSPDTIFHDCANIFTDFVADQHRRNFLSYKLYQNRKRLISIFQATPVCAAVEITFITFRVFHQTWLFPRNFSYSIDSWLHCGRWCFFSGFMLFKPHNILVQKYHDIA